MQNDDWFPCYPAKLTSNASRLCPHDFGAYWRLLCDYYQNGPLPDDDEALRNISGVREGDWARTKGNIMVAPFFQMNGDGKWHQKCADEVIADRQERLKAILDGSAKGVKKRREMGQLPPEKNEPKDEPGDDPGDIPMDAPLDKAKENTSTDTSKSIGTSISTMKNISISIKGDSTEKSDWNGMTLSRKMIEVLGLDEIARSASWGKRADHSPKKLEKILNTIHAEIAQGRIVKNRGAYAETCWKNA